MFNLSSWEIILIALVILLIFGGQKLSEFARSLGNTSKELKKAKNELETAMSDTEKELNSSINLSGKNNTKGKKTKNG